MEGLNDYKKAGKIASRARNWGFSLIKENANFYEIVNSVEKKILKMGGQIAFPINLSLNEFAAHDTAERDDERVLKAGDVVKLDVGVHIDGYIADTAVTREVSTKEHKKLIESSKKALESAIKILKPGVTLGEIGEVIESTITSFFLPVKYK